MVPSVAAGHEEVVGLLLQHGADINVQSVAGLTPLYMAAQANKVSVVECLLLHHADPNITTKVFIKVFLCVTKVTNSL